jgi:uncharacterized protein (TIGR02679 family)
MDADAVSLYTAPEYKRLLDAARRSLERTGGDLTRTITVKTPDDKERRAIIGITGQYRPEGTGLLAVRLTDLDTAVRETAGHGLVGLLEHIGPPLRDRSADRQRLADIREAALRSVDKTFLTERGWFQSWLAELAADGTLAKLINSGEPNHLKQAVRVIEWIDQRIDLKAAPRQLAELAATITGDTKALNSGTTLAALVLRALAARQGAARPRTVEERRDLWDQCGIIVDDLASRVLVLNLPAYGPGLGEWLASAAEHGAPFYVTLQQLVTFALTVTADVVSVCETPAVLRRAAADLGAAARPVICTEGQPSTAFHRLAAAVTAGGGTLRYHGDFDWPGIAIAASVMTRHGATPWRFAAADYQAALTARTADHIPLKGEPQPTPWDPALADAMSVASRAVYEESAVTDLIRDLA